MEKLFIQGGRRLGGTIAISGMKNAALPILFACALNRETCVIQNVPAVSDIALVGRICTLEALGRWDEALAAVAAAEPTLLNAEKAHYLAGELRLAKARILCQKGDKGAALEVLAPMLTAAEGSDLANYQDQAKRTKAMIEAYTPKSLFEKAAEATAQ